jgi:hypothetical protein
MALWIRTKSRARFGRLFAGVILCAPRIFAQQAGAHGCPTGPSRAAQRRRTDQCGLRGGQAGQAPPDAQRVGSASTRARVNPESARVAFLPAVLPTQPCDGHTDFTWTPRKWNGADPTSPTFHTVWRIAWRSAAGVGWAASISVRRMLERPVRWQWFSADHGRCRRSGLATLRYVPSVDSSHRPDHVQVPRLVRVQYASERTR